MRPRGPDAGGLLMTEGVALGHRRLAILDLEPAPTSRWFQPTDATPSFSTARSTTSASCAGAEAERDQLPHDVRHRSAAGAVRARRRAHVAAASRDVCLCHLGHSSARAVPGPRSVRHQAALLRTDEGAACSSHRRSRRCWRLVSCLSSGSPPQWRASTSGAACRNRGRCIRDAFALPAGHWLRVRDGVPGTPVCWSDIREHWRERHTVLRRNSRIAVRAALTDAVARISWRMCRSACSCLAASTRRRWRVWRQAWAPASMGSRSDSRSSPAVRRRSAGGRGIAAHYGLRHHVRRVSRAEFDRGHPAHSRCDGSTLDRRCQHLVRQQGSRRARFQGGACPASEGTNSSAAIRFPRDSSSGGSGACLAAIPGALDCCWAFPVLLARMRSQPKLAGVPTYMNSVEGMYFLRRGLFLRTNCQRSWA